MFFDAQAVLFTFVVLSPSFRKVKTKNEAVLMCDYRVTNLSFVHEVLF